MPENAIKFEDFELDAARYELRRSGRALKLEKIPMELLILLAARKGDLVTRQEIVDRLWGNDVFVDTEHGINTAIRKIRRTLCDDPEQPRFVQTVTGKGYRFIATVVEGNGRKATPASVDANTSAEVPQIAVVAPVQAKDTRRAWPVWLSIVSLFALFVVAYIVWRRANAPAPEKAAHVMLVVLPFENLSGDPNEEYFSDGLTEEIISQLGAVSPDQMGVIARTTSMAYKRTSKSAQQIGRELHVDYILESSVRRDGDRTRITVQLIRGSDQLHVWAQNYDRPLSHSIALQEEVAKAVAEQVKIKLSPGRNGGLERHSLDPQANEAYLRGRFFGNQFTVAGYRKAIDYFQQAIDRDPNFAEAYSGLADSYYFLVVTDAIAPKEGEAKALEAAKKSVELGEGLAESHNALASVMQGLTNWPAAEKEFRRAIDLNPSYSTTHRVYAALLVTLKRYDEALDQINQAMRTDPLSLPNNAEVVRTLYYRRDYDRAIEEGKKALQLDPGYYRTHFWLSRVYGQKKMYAEALASSKVVETAMPDSTVALTEMAYNLAESGHQNEARRALHRLEEKSKHEFVPAYNFAIIHVALNEPDRALDYLQKAYEENDWALMVLAVEPRLDPLRGNAKFEELLANCKLK